MPQQAEQPRPVFCEDVPIRKLPHPQHPQPYRHNGLEYVRQDDRQRQRSAERPVEVGKSRVAAAVVADVVPQDILRYDDRPVKAAAEIRLHRDGEQKNSGKFQPEQDFRSLLHIHGNHSSLSPFWRMVIRIGVPSSPNTLRIWFSRYRW